MTVPDPSTPALVGAAQVANKDDDRIVAPADLVVEAARRALADAGLDVGAVRGVLATPFTTTDAGDASEEVAAALRVGPGLRGTSSYSGAGPQVLLARAVRAVAEGAGPVLVVGGIADASVARARRRGLPPPAPPTAPWSQGSEQAARARPRPGPSAEVAAGAGFPPSWFALVESAMPGADLSAAHRVRLGTRMAPFTEVAACRPDVAWWPEVRSAEAIATPGDDNRLVAEPYTKRMCSFPTVDLAAAVVVAPARPGDPRAVHPWAIATAKEAGPPSTWAAMGRSAALHRAVEAALGGAATDIGALGAFDLYSCFPSAVGLAVDALGLEGADDPRPLTLTGGLAAFGGPGASYSLHALVCTVEHLRAGGDGPVGVVSVGGMVTDFAVGVYALGEPGPTPVPLVELPPEGAGRPAVEVVRTADGPAVVDAMTVLHERGRGPVAAPVVARLPDGTRVGARAADADLPAALSERSLVGTEVHLRTDPAGHVTYTL